MRCCVCWRECRVNIVFARLLMIGSSWIGRSLQGYRDHSLISLFTMVMVPHAAKRPRISELGVML